MFICITGTSHRLISSSFMHTECTAHSQISPFHSNDSVSNRLIKAMKISPIKLINTSIVIQYVPLVGDHFQFLSLVNEILHFIQLVNEKF